MAQSSLNEVDAPPEISEHLSFLTQANGKAVGNLQADVEKFLSGLIRSISKH